MDRKIHTIIIPDKVGIMHDKDMSFKDMWDAMMLFLEQSKILSYKHLMQKKRNSRSTVKEVILTPLVIAVFTGYLMITINGSIAFPSAVYDQHQLPPLSTDGYWGIFSTSSEANNDDSYGYVSSKTIYYSPNTNAGVNDVMDAMKTMYPQINLIGVATSDDLEDEYAANLYDTYAALEFELSSTQTTTDTLVDPASANSVVYQLRINPNIEPLPTAETSDVYNNDAAEVDVWSNSGYLTIQNFVASYLASVQINDPGSVFIDTYLQRYPSNSEYDNDIEFDWSQMRWYIWKWMSASIWTVILYIPCLGLLTQCVREIQFRMKDLLEISGLYAISFWTSFFVVLVLITQVTMWVCIMILWGMETLSQQHVIPYFALLTCFVFPLITSSFAFGHLVNQSEYYGLPIFLLNTAMSVAGVFVANSKSMSMGGKLVLGIFAPPINLAVGVFTIETWCYHNTGETMSLEYYDADKYLPSVDAVCLCFVASSLIYLFIAVGFPFDWLFPKDSDGVAVLAAAARQDVVQFPCDDEDAVKTAAKPDDRQALLQVDDLSQIYPDGTQAVKGMSFKVYEGEVLSYLGANGAGKSTTMSMLSGTLIPTYGDAVVNGYSITRDRTNARRNLGICMQQDIIWDDVSVENHLYIFGKLRGLSGKKLDEDVQRMVESLGFPEKAKSLAGTLSGGQKRRLCVGLSMVGGNSVVFLDEPTAGLDPVSRRQLWELVQANRAGRAILLTTHFMDEADVLGDRIAIVKEGRMRAIGSAKFLKQQFGLGYLLRASMKSATLPNAIIEKMQKFVPSAALVSSAGSELAIRLPKEAVNDFPDMMECLETEGKKNLGVLSFGIETTTLEEVFMRIVNEDNESLISAPEEANRLLGASTEERKKQQEVIAARDAKRNPISEAQVQLILTKGRKSDRDGGSAASGVSDSAVFMSQLRVLLWKRRHQFDRSRGQWAFSCFIPITMAILCAVLLLEVPTNVVGDNPDVTAIYYNTSLSTPVGAPDATLANSWSTEAGLAPTNFVGDNYSSVSNYVQEQTNDGYAGTSSIEGVYFDSPTNFSVMYNATYNLAMPGVVEELLNGAVSNITNNLLEITTLCIPLPLSLTDDQANYGIMFAFVFSLLTGSIGGGMSIVLSGERVGLVKHQQLASGTSKLVYWTSNFIWDFSLMFFQMLVFIIALICADATDYGSPYDFSNVLGAAVVAVLALIFRFYVISFMVDDVKLAQSIFFYGSLFLMYAMCIVWMNILLVTNNGNLGTASQKIVTFLCAFLDPTFGFAIFVLFKRNFEGAESMHPGIQDDLILPMFLSMMLFFVFLVYVEFGNDIGSAIIRWFSCASKNDDRMALTQAAINEDAEVIVSDEKFVARISEAVPRMRVGGSHLDPDVALEKEQVHETYRSKKLNCREHSIFIHQLRKVFPGRATVPTKVAINDVSLSVQQGEVFGLLGANGAGKTTLLKIVSGLELPTSGQAYINGYDVVNNRTEAQRSMGLCPQFDTLVERLSVRENLMMFGQIKGIVTDLELTCDAFMVALNIKKYENKLIQHLSGGNRRKVSLAVALLGCPPTVYLDEPSTGLDPVASRMMWRLLSKIASTKSNAMVLTTHNMLECESVCTRIGVMKNGELVCLGDSQHLRSVHGTGFLLEVNLSHPSFVPVAKQFTTTHFEGATIIDEHSTMINYEIPATSIAKLSQAFRLMESNKQALGIVDYGLSQSTLEQVFLKQIRPSGVEALDPELQAKATRKAKFADFFNGYAVWLISVILPGLHQYYLGDTGRAIKYFFTVNELWVGWALDLIDMHIFIQKRVEMYGNSEGICCGLFECAWCCCTAFGCCQKKKGNNTTSRTEGGAISSVERGF